MKRGGQGFDLDTDFLKEQEKLMKLKAQQEQFGDPFAKDDSKKDGGKSLKDMLREKREATEKQIAGKAPPEESKEMKEKVEERQRRLREQRDLLR